MTPSEPGPAAGASRATTCLCYTTNRGYALPTLLSAAQARRHLPPGKADVVVLFVTETGDDARAIAPVCANHGILLQVVAPEDIDRQPIQFARHFLDRLLDPGYGTVIHIDGDTQIADTLEPLVDAVLPPGKIFAAPDPMALMIEAKGRTWAAHRAYFRSIGMEPATLGRYVNTGLFMAHRRDLGTIGAECVRLCHGSAGRFRFSEQDAFNLAFHRDIALISMRWNYPAFFSNFACTHALRPHVRHFMSNPRPWQGTFPPWNAVDHRAYLDFVRAHPAMTRFQQPVSAAWRLRYRIQQRYKRLVEPVFWNRALGHRLGMFEQAAAV